MAPILKSLSFELLVILAFVYPSVMASSQSHAQVLSDSEYQAEENVTVYEPNFFKQYRPTHAKDMLERIPGATAALTGSTGNLAGNSQRRGLRSQTTQILVNGTRLTTKGNSVQDYFQRIPASQVERIEVITGNVREIDADVGSRVINVVLSDTSRLGGTWNIGTVIFTDEQVEPTLSGSLSGENGPWSYTIVGETRPRQVPRKEIQVFRNAAGATFQDSIENRRVESRRYLGRGRIAYAFAQDHKAQINGFVEDRPVGNWIETEFVTEINADGARRAAGGNQFMLTGRDLRYEISGDYTFPLSPSLSFKGLFVYTFDDTEREVEDFTFFNNPTELTPSGGDTRDEKATEKILRGTFEWAFTQKQSLEVGVEGAINSLDKAQTFFDIIDGQRVGLDVFNADQDVSEDRIEAFGNHNWRPTSRWEIETGLAGEFSTLDQLGSDVDTNRNFTFAKPSLDVWYRPSERTQFFVSVRRDIGQLDFEDFIADLDREDNEIDAGNPALAPEKSWDFETGVEHRLDNQAGVINLRAFFRDVSDVRDQVPFGINDSAPGNLGTGLQYGAEIETSLQLNRLGLIDAVISSTFLWQNSEVDDPFTGESRRFGDQKRYKWTVDARHDVQAWNISYGTAFSLSGPEIQSDFDTFERFKNGPNMRLFIERRFDNGLVGRFFWSNVLRAKNKRTRIVYAVSQADGTIEQSEFRTRRTGSFYSFSVRGTF